MITNREHIIMITKALYDSGAKSLSTAHLSKEKKIEFRNSLVFINHIEKGRKRNSK